MMIMMIMMMRIVAVLLLLGVVVVSLEMVRIARILILCVKILRTWKDVSENHLQCYHSWLVPGNDKCDRNFDDDAVVDLGEGEMLEGLQRHCTLMKRRRGAY
jgi:hypothetical protein